jgi:phosphopantothenoylcysteine synthetase/decarboxylase
MPDEDRLPAPDAVLAAPLTFNSLNKWAAGIADTFALGVLTEVIGEHRPVVVVAWAKPALASHPAFRRSLKLLSSLGGRLIDNVDEEPMDPTAEVPEFPWKAALAALPTP